MHIKNWFEIEDETSKVEVRQIRELIYNLDMAKTLSSEEKLGRQLEADIKKLEKERQTLSKNTDRFEEKLDNLQDKIEDLKDRDKISSEQEHELKDLLDTAGKNAKESEDNVKNPTKRQFREIDQELRMLESKIQKEGKSDSVEDSLDGVEEKINELKKAGSDDKEVWKKIKRLEGKLDTIK